MLSGGVQDGTNVPGRRQGSNPVEEALELQGLVKRYGSFMAVAGIDLTVRRGEFFTLLGPSGSGKTTILRLIAGFERPSAGRILLGGRDISPLSPAERGIGVVFQHYTLFPHLTVSGNIAYPLKLRRWTRLERSRRVEEMLSVVRLEGFGGRYPRELSGGEQQRVALARALSFRPTLLIMDEPLGALDKGLRVELQWEFARVQRETGATVVYITHDHEEAFAMSDRIGVLRSGHLIQQDRAQILYESPCNTFVAKFFGNNLLIQVEQLLSENAGSARVRVLGREVEIRRSSALNGRRPWLLIRQDRVRFETSHADLTIPAQVTAVVYLGGKTLVRSHSPQLGDVVVQIESREAGTIAVGQNVCLGFNSSEAVVVPED